MNKKVRNAAVIAASALALLSQTLPGIAGTSGSKSCSGAIGDVRCEGNASYQQTWASASTATPDEYGNCTVTLSVRLGTGPNSGGSYSAPVSNSGMHATTMSRQNDAGKVINGCRSTHSVTFGGGSWSQKLELN